MPSKRRRTRLGPKGTPKKKREPAVKKAKVTLTEVCNRITDSLDEQRKSACDKIVQKMIENKKKHEAKMLKRAEKRLMKERSSE